MMESLQPPDATLSPTIDKAPELASPYKHEDDIVTTTEHLVGGDHRHHYDTHESSHLDRPYLHLPNMPGRHHRQHLPQDRHQVYAPSSQRDYSESQRRVHVDYDRQRRAFPIEHHTVATTKEDPPHVYHDDNYNKVITKNGGRSSPSESIPAKKFQKYTDKRPQELGEKENKDQPLHDGQENHSTDDDDDAHDDSTCTPKKKDIKLPEVKNSLDTEKSISPDKDDIPSSYDVDELEHIESDDEDGLEVARRLLEEKDPEALAQNELIRTAETRTELEIALKACLGRKEAHIHRLTTELIKLKAFISKRKQTYKRKRKDDSAPIRPLSAYNIFIQDRFAKLAKENEIALKSDDADAQMKRVPPSNLVASTGNEWKELPHDEKAKYEERAKADRKRYEEEMTKYQPPEKHSNRKRNKTGYNMFFSAHVLRLKATDKGVPSERGSVARLVGTAWKLLSADEKQYYEREADKHNGMNPAIEGDEEEDEDDLRRLTMVDTYTHHTEMHVPPPPPPHHQPIHPSYDPRIHPHHHHHPAYYAHPPPAYTQPYAYDYSQHHQRQSGRASSYSQSHYHSRHYADSHAAERM